MRVRKLKYANREPFQRTPWSYSLKVSPAKNDVFSYLFTKKKVLKMSVIGHWSMKVNTIVLLFWFDSFYGNGFRFSPNGINYITLDVSSEYVKRLFDNSKKYVFIFMYQKFSVRSLILKCKVHFSLLYSFKINILKTEQMCTAQCYPTTNLLHYWSESAV